MYILSQSWMKHCICKCLLGNWNLSSLLFVWKLETQDAYAWKLKPLPAHKCYRIEICRCIMSELWWWWRGLTGGALLCLKLRQPLVREEALCGAQSVLTYGLERSRKRKGVLFKLWLTEAFFSEHSLCQGFLTGEKFWRATQHWHQVQDSCSTNEKLFVWKNKIAFGCKRCSVVRCFAVVHIQEFRSGS